MSEETKRLETEYLEAKKKREEFVDRPGETFTTAVLEGVIPGYGLLRNSLMSEEEARFEQQKRQASPTAHELGNILGLVGGAVSPTGLAKGTVGGLLNVAGKSAAKGIKGTGFWSTAARLGTEGAVQGAGAALSEGSSEAALNAAAGDPASGWELAKEVGKGAAWGGGIGGGLAVGGGVANFLFRGAAKKHIARYAENLEARKNLHLRQLDLKQQADDLLQKYTPEQLAYANGQYATEAGRQYSQITGQRFVPKYGKIVSEATGEESALGRLSKDVQNIDQRISRGLTGDLDKGSEAVRKELGTLGRMLMWSVAPVHAVKGMVASAFFGPAIEAVTGKVTRGLPKETFFRAATSASLSQGRLSLTKKVFDKATGTLVDKPIEKYSNIVSHLGDYARFSAEIPPVQYMTQDDYDTVRRELATVDIGEFERQIRFSYAAKGIPQAVANAQMEKYTRAIGYVNSVMPQPRGGEWVTDSREPPKIPESERLGFSRVLRAAFVPESVIADFLNDKLTVDAVKTWWAVHPEEAAFLAKELERIVNSAVLRGKRFSAKEQKMIAMMMDPTGTKLGKLNDKNLVQALQMTYANEEAQVPPPRVGGPGQMGSPKAFNGYSTKAATLEQQINTRAQKRR